MKMNMVRQMLIAGISATIAFFAYMYWGTIYQAMLGNIATALAFGGTNIAIYALIMTMLQKIK